MSDYSDIRPVRNTGKHKGKTQNNQQTPADNVVQDNQQPLAVNFAQEGHDGGQDQLDHPDGAVNLDGVFGLGGWCSLLCPVISLIAFVVDIGSDILLTLEYKSKGDENFFYFTLAFIIFPVLFVVFSDLSWLYIDSRSVDHNDQGPACEGQEMIDRPNRHPPENKANHPAKPDSFRLIKVLGRIILGLFSFGVVVRIIQHMYYKYKKKTATSIEDRYMYRDKVRITIRDYTLLNFIFAFTETYCQVSLQLYIFTLNPENRHRYRNLEFSIITSLIFMPLAYAAHYRSIRLQAPEGGLDKRDMVLPVYVFYYLGVLSGMTFRIVSISMFLAALPLTVGIPLVNLHFLFVFLWLLFWHKPSYNGLIVSRNKVLRNLGKFLYTALYGVASMLFFVDLYERDNQRFPTKWRLIGYNIVLYIESAVFIILGFVLRDSFLQAYMELYAMVLFVCCLVHLIVIAIYYQFMHPTIGICYHCTDASSTSDNPVAGNEEENPN